MPIAPAVGAALVSTGGALLSGLTGLFGQQHANVQNYKQQLALLQNQQDFTREMWDKQTAENRMSILNQYAQYRQLGINPLAALGGMSQSNQTAPSAPSAPQANYKNPLEGAETAVMLSQAVKNIADAKKSESENKESQARTAFVWSQKQTEDALRDKRIQALGVDIRLGESKIRVNNKDEQRLTSEIDLIGKRMEEIDANIANSTLVAESEYWSMVNNWIHNRAMEQHWTVEEQQKWKEIANETRRVSAYIQDVNSLCEQRRHQNDLTDAEKAEVEQRTQNLKKEGERLGYQVDFEKNTLQWRIDAQNMQYELQYQADSHELFITNAQYEYDKGHRQHTKDMYALEKVISPVKEILGLFGMAYGFGRGASSMRQPSGISVTAPNYTTSSTLWTR